MSAMTPDQFFDALDELFGTDDGYVNHLKRIINLKHLKEDMEENWLSEEDVSAQVDPLYEEIKNVKKNAMKQVHKLNKENKKLKENVKELKQENSMVRDLLQNRVPVGCIAETTYQPILEKNEGLREQVAELKHQLTNLQMNHIDMKCEITGTTLTEDDLQMSLDVGRLICESAYDDLDYDDKKTRTELQEKITCLESDSMNEVSQVEFDEMVEEKDEEIKELKHQLTQQKGKYDFLESVSINKTMDTNSTDDIIKLEQENKELKLKLLVADVRC